MWIQEGETGIADGKVGKFGAIQGQFRASRGLWRRDRTLDEQRLQARRQWNTYLFSLSSDRDLMLDMMTELKSMESGQEAEAGATATVPLAPAL